MNALRELKFVVEGQIVSADPECDFSNLIPGTDGYLQASFSFSKEWCGCVKAVGFWANNEECPAQLLEDGKTCIIPPEALKGRRFTIGVYGRGHQVRLATNKITITQDGGM